MNSYEELKLAVYESGMDFDDACNIITVVENCDDDELEEVIESVLELVEESNNNTAVPAHTSVDKKKIANNAIVAGGAIGAFTAGRGARNVKKGQKGLYVYSVQIDQYKDKLKKLTRELSYATTPSEQKKLESQIDKIQNKIRTCEQKVEKAKKMIKKGDLAFKGGSALAIGSIAANYKLNGNGQK